MFDNIGKKIKSVAYTIAVLSIIAGVISTVIAFFAIQYEEDIGFPLLLISIIATIVSVISTYPLYALGQLVENSDSIIFLLSNESTRPQNTSTNVSNISATEKFLASATPTSPASTTLTTNPVNTQVTNQSSITQSPADIVSELKVFACPYCGKKYKARPMSRVVCPHCHMKIN